MKRSVIVFLTVLTITLTLTLAVGVRARIAKPQVQVAAAVDDDDQHGAGPVRMLRFVLFADSIYPRKQTISAGMVRLVQQDETGQSAGLVLERLNESNRSQILQIESEEGAERGSAIVRLTAGVYRVYDSSSPDNSAELTVRP